MQKMSFSSSASALPLLSPNSLTREKSNGKFHNTLSNKNKMTSITSLTTEAAQPTSTATSTKLSIMRTGRLRNYFIKKKRKLRLNKMLSMQIYKDTTTSSTAIPDPIEADKIRIMFVAANDDTKMMTRTTTTTTNNICLICRQPIKECCMRCCQIFKKEQKKSLEQQQQQQQQHATKTTQLLTTARRNFGNYLPHSIANINKSTRNNCRIAVWNWSSDSSDDEETMKAATIKEEKIFCNSTNRWRSYKDTNMPLSTAIIRSRKVDSERVFLNNCQQHQHQYKILTFAGCNCNCQRAAVTTKTTTTPKTPTTRTSHILLLSSTSKSSSSTSQISATLSNPLSINSATPTTVAITATSSSSTILRAHATKDVSSHFHSTNNYGKSGTNDSINNYSHVKTNNQIVKFIKSSKTPATLATTTTTTKQKSSNQTFVPLRILQFLIIFIQTHLLRFIYNNNISNNRFNSKNINNKDNNLIGSIYNKRQHLQQQQQQQHQKQQQQLQRPPIIRLNQQYLHNSYSSSSKYYNYNYHNDEHNNTTNVVNDFNNNNNNSKIINSSHYRQNQQQHHQQQKQQQQNHQLSEKRKKQQQHNCYFKLPNLSQLYKILIVLSFLSLSLPSTQAQASATSSSSSSSSSLVSSASLSLPKIPTTSGAVRLSRSETVCKSMDLRNTPGQLIGLQNCTVIEGILIIALVNTHTQAEFTESYPLLTEVTDHIIIYRVHNLRSLAQIFPNLSIIRGRKLFEGYALVVYSNPHLEELGLSKLTTILNGGVRIENNLSLCFVETVDWTQIIANNTDNIIKNNREECPQCPGDEKSDSQDSSNADKAIVCPEYHGNRHCWNSKTCQKICPERCRNNCIDENTCCNDSCLGGCSTDDKSACMSCRHFSISNTTCIDECPPNYFKYLERRCITASNCASIGKLFEVNKEEDLVAYEGNCTTHCPEGYTKTGTTCLKCDGKCLKKCLGGLIDTVQRAKELHGCTHIVNEGLTISIKRGGRHLMEDLEFGLSSIQVIETFLKVHRTFGMFSLKYFKNLREIRGSVLCENKFALYVLENTDLETIWGENRTVRIESGRVFFHFNPKLCYSEIEAIRPMMRNNSTFDKNEVATDSNGYKGSCNTEELEVGVELNAATVVVVAVKKPLVFDDERTFIGYQYYLMEDKYKNATKHSYRPCDDTWNQSEPTKETKYIFNALQPYTQYAYYVKTMTISSEARNAESPIKYFRTKSSQPNFVQNLRAYANSSSEIIITWQPPNKPNGKIIKYKLSAVLDKSNITMESRNYCDEPLTSTKDLDKTAETFVKPFTEKPRLPADCKCQKDSESVYDVESSEAKIHDEIEFENALQNFVYVKQQKNKTEKVALVDGTLKRSRRSCDDGSVLMRHIRALPDDLAEKLSSSTIGNSNGSATTTIAPPEVSSYAPANETRMDPNNEYYEVIYDVVNENVNEYVFTKLKHFSLYVLHVEACREYEEGAANGTECSQAQVGYARTAKLKNVDKVRNLEVTLETTNSSLSTVRIHWDPPETPNGVIVSYTISYKLEAKDAVEEKRCITEFDYRNMTNGYFLRGLPTGNYSVSVRANSLAGEGIFSEKKYIFIPPTKTFTPGVIAGICVAVVGFLVLSFLGLYFYCRYQKNKKELEERKMLANVNPNYVSLQYIPDEWEVTRERVLQKQPLGQGSFGMVYEGVLKGSNNDDDIPCAIKTVNENATERERSNFLNEASVMKQFKTYHVVRLLGVCSLGQPALVVMELMKQGDLKSYLRRHRPDGGDDSGGYGNLEARNFPSSGLLPQPPPLSRIYQMAIEIADGMAYLAAKKFVHRDLAARNCMVAADLTVKIGDFGMTRDIYETDYYRKGTKGLLPVRWMPPESLRDGVYSSSSDVFSYGVVLWEMATLASQPYQGFSNDQVLRYVIDGGVMERPDNCPDKLYRLMQKCWHHRPSARPTFMEIIRYLLNLADPHFCEVSFYHTEEGQKVEANELSENAQHSNDIFADDDNDMDDATTPLRMDEYNDYKNMQNTLSVENQNESPGIGIDDDAPHHSPYSLSSAIVLSSTPDGQSKNSYSISQMSHNQQTTLSSAPSTSAGQRQLHQPYNSRYPHSQLAQNSQPDDAAYVQPDFDAQDIHASSGLVASKSMETDERGYEMYDPSPSYTKQAPYATGDDEEDFEDLDSNERSRHYSGGQNLLPRSKAGRARMPQIMPMSSSMPDEVSIAPMSSSLHPSTASAGSSNASSTTATAKYPSLKAVADTVQNVGSSLMPARLRNFNRRLFNHKRTSSNASRKSTGSNPNASSKSNINQNEGSVGFSMSGHNLGTIESGGSGSAGSYCGTAAGIMPRFFTPVTGTASSDNPNYKLLDESGNDSYISSAGVPAPTNITPARNRASSNTSAAPTTYSSSGNPNYKLLEESLNKTVTPAKPNSGREPRTSTSASENPNYEPMNAPAPRCTVPAPQQAANTTPTTTTMVSSANPNYVMMNEPQPRSTTPVRLSDNPNYSLMAPISTPAPAPPPATVTTPVNTSTPSSYFTALRREREREHFRNSATSSSSSSEDEQDDDDNDAHTEHIKMETMPLSRRRSSERAKHKRTTSRSRSRSHSQTKGDDKLSYAAASTPNTASTATAPSTAFSLKEKWLRQQSQAPPPPPPNGFIGREA